MDRLAEACEEMERHASRRKKTRILEDYFATLSAEERAIARQLLNGGPMVRAAANGSLFEAPEKTRLTLGRSVLREALQAATGWDKETLRVCQAQVGDAGETAGLLLRGVGAGQAMSLEEAQELYGQLGQAGTAARQAALAAAIFRKYRPLTVKYFVKAMTRGWRVGVAEEEGRLGAETLTVAITAAERGSGGVFSGYTLGVRAGGGFVNLGTAEAGLTEEERQELNRRLRAAAVEKFGRTTLVKPEMVLEVAFEGIERSARRKAGYALRMARIVRWRRDKRAEECDGLEEVEERYRAGGG